MTKRRGFGHGVLSLEECRRQIPGHAEEHSTCPRSQCHPVYVYRKV